MPKMMRYWHSKKSVSFVLSKGINLIQFNLGGGVNDGTKANHTKSICSRIGQSRGMDKVCLIDKHDS
jgi:hypothetical protein